MKNKILWTLMGIGSIFCLAACSGNSAKVRVEKNEGGTLYVCEVNQVKDSIQIPLSELLKSIHIVKLDTAREALIRGGMTVLSDNFIGVKPWGQEPFKLFDKSGKFLRNIGNIGKGPNEYLNLYHAQIDEKNNRVYLMPWQTRQLLVYDLEGNALSPIELPGFLPKAKFFVNNQQLSVVVLPFEKQVDYIAFSQNLDGTDFKGIKPGYLAIPFDYSNEVYTFNRGDQMDFYVSQFFTAAQDTLYYFDTQQNRLVPQFTANFNGKIPQHVFMEFGDYFYVETMTQKEVKPNTFMAVPEKRIVVSKKDKNARYFSVVDDMLFKGENVFPGAFGNGLFIQNYPAIAVISRLEKVLERDDLTEEVKQRIQTTLEGLNENDNNIVIWGELK